MTDFLFRKDPYLREATARVMAIIDHDNIVLDRSIFYPTGGGQDGDTGRLSWDGAEMVVAGTHKTEDSVALICGSRDMPPPGTEVRQILDWEPRYRRMRLHTCLHLLSVVIPLPVTGGQITDLKGRLDFDMPDPPEDKQAIEDRLNALIAQDHPVTEEWITDAELAANPGLIKTMSVKPPIGAGKVRLVRIGTPDAQIDLQPCGGTHVARTAEIGPVTLGKIEKKGKRNRRVSVYLADA